MKEMMDFLDSKEDEMIEMLCRWVRQDSIADYHPDAPLPYGEGCAKMLSLALSDAENLGFSNPRNHAYHVGTVETGSGKPALGIACHLDVVPVSPDGWTHDPFGGEVSDGKVYGRGTSDNKCSGVSALYAMLAYRKFCPAGKNVKLYLGCCEEAGMHDFEYYLSHVEKKEEMPPMIVPDAGTVIGYGCTGGVIANFDTDARGAGEVRLDSIESGGASSVPGIAIAVVRGLGASEIPLEPILDCPIQAEETEGGVKITVTGKACHPAGPEAGKNAANAVIKLLLKLPIAGDERRVLEVLDAMYREMDTRKANHSGIPMTFVMTELTLKDGHFHLTHNSRSQKMGYTDELEEVYRTYLTENGFTVTYRRKTQPYAVDPNCDLVRKLVAAQTEFEGVPPKVIQIDASNYSRCFDMGVSFGQYSALMAHRKDEYIPVDYVLKSAKLLCHAIWRLAGNPEE